MAAKYKVGDTVRIVEYPYSPRINQVMKQCNLSFYDELVVRTIIPKEWGYATSIYGVSLNGRPISAMFLEVELAPFNTEVDNTMLFWK